MPLTATIPLIVRPEAAARITELGMQRELDQMLEYALKTLPGLQSLEVVLELPWDTGDETRITIEAICPALADPTHDPAGTQWRDWFLDTFPPEIRSMMSLLLLYGTSP